MFNNMTHPWIIEPTSIPLLLFKSAEREDEKWEWKLLAAKAEEERR